MAANIAVHQCLFCPQTFNSASEKDDHVLEHFAQETCTECNQRLLRIGSNLYTIHNAVTCIGNGLKREQPFLCDVEYKANNYNERNNENTNDDWSIMKESICVENLQIKSEPFDQYGSCTSMVKEMNDKLADQTESNILIDETLQVDIVEEENGRECKQFNLNNHQENVQRKRKNRSRSICDICNQIVHTNALARHKKVKHCAEGTPICKFCAKIFDNADDLASHRQECITKKKIRRDNVPLVKCNGCGKLMHSDSMSRHKKICSNIHSSNENVSMIADQPKCNTEKSNDNEQCINDTKFKCKLCDNVYRFKASLQRHMKTSHDPNSDQNCIVPCQICGKTMNVFSIPRHMRVTHSEPGQHVCKTCSKVFPSEEVFLAHKPECTLRKSKQGWNKNGQFECMDCKKVFCSKGSLYKHMKVYHDPNNTLRNEQSAPVPCQICNKLMRTDSVAKHMRLQHSAPNTPICRICVIIFPNEEEFIKHQQECDKIGEFKCDTCKKMFHLKASLIRHVRTVHDPKREKEAPIACDVCGKLMSSKSIRTHNIIKHSAPGTPVCKTCAKIFPSEKELESHRAGCLLKKKFPSSKR